jgi:IgGFc binding protein
MNVRIPRARAVSFASLALLAAAAACGKDRDPFDGSITDWGTPDAGSDANCPFQCALDGRSVLRSCTGEVVETCAPEQACGGARCQEPCSAAAEEKSSNGCEFYFQSPATYGDSPDNCYATFIVNASTQPANITFEREGTALDISKAIFRTSPGDATLIPHSGPIAPGESVILFVSDHDPEQPLSGDYAACPTGVVPAVLSGLSTSSTGVGSSFHLKSSVPVSLAAIYPFGGAQSYLPSATLLLPVVTWSTQHIVVNPWEGFAGMTTQILASEDDTEVTILPTHEIQNGSGVRGTAAKVPATYRLSKGQYIQLVQAGDLSGSIVTSTKPTTTFGGHLCANIPTTGGACDSLHQQIPAFDQWGSEYVAVGYRPRIGDEHEAMPYRIVAARDGTRLDYDPAIPAGAPTEMNAGESVTFPAGTGDAFVVRTQDADHPIYVGAYMTGKEGGYFGSPPTGNLGDPEFVNVVPAGQYLNSYSFFADPSYPETSLVIVRAKTNGVFKDVWLECAGGPLTDFRPIGTRGEFEFTRVDLAKGNGPGSKFGDKVCQTGVQRMKSEGPFTATVWGWGRDSSYAYPGGTAIRKLVTTPLGPIR